MFLLLSFNHSSNTFSYPYLKLIYLMFGKNNVNLLHEYQTYFSKWKKINVVDYATHNVDYKKLHLFNLNSLKPKWIPWVDEEYFVNNNFFICPVKRKDNKYLFSRASKYKGNHDRIVLVNLDLLVLTQNYYFEKMKRDIYNPSSLIFNSHVSYFYKKGQHKIRKLSSNKMSSDQMELAELIYGSKELAWEKYPELLKEISYKQNDLRHHSKDHQNSYSKGQETSFGIKNINNSLFYELGIGLKLQNGDVKRNRNNCINIQE